MVGGAETGSRVERTRSKTAAGGPSKVADCGAGWAKLHLVDGETDPQPKAPAQGNKASNL